MLLVGNTGAGKSTTALSCLAQPDLCFLSDDKCLVRLDPAPQAFAAFSSGKIKADMLERLPQFRDKLRGWDDNYKAGKGLVYLYPDYADRLVTSFPIKALVLPTVTHQAQADDPTDHGPSARSASLDRAQSSGCRAPKRTIFASRPN